MKIRSCHERSVAATAERIGTFIADFDSAWPTRIAPAPRLRGHRLYEAGVMLWEEVDRQGAVRAFRVVQPDELRAEHWFEVEPADGATVVRHTMEGCALGRYEALWSERIAPLHDQVMEAFLDNLEAAVASDG